ncbi:MAG: hypothetical protein RJA98_1361 [Pseudomonadota bacterium]|jgi:NAD(P)-dependent dehydrogenase (short-subunit alcohol dehydrogenase family)
MPSDTPTTAPTTRTVLITGASRGIGAATALLAAERGWDVAVNYRHDRAAAEAVAAGVRGLGQRAVTLQADVGDEASVVAMFALLDEAVAHGALAPLGALVNNAGVLDVAARVEDMSAARLTRMWATNLTGPMLCAREAIRRLGTRHGGAGGVIVNVSSGAARIGSPGVYLDYSMSKAAIDHLTTGLAREVAADGVRVNAVRPGIIDTEIHASGGHSERVAATAASLISMGRLGLAREVAPAIVWLLSAEAGYTTGAVLDVTGGR